MQLQSFPCIFLLGMINTTVEVFTAVRTLTEEAEHRWIQSYMPGESQLTSYSQVDQG